MAFILGLNSTSGSGNACLSETGRHRSGPELLDLGFFLKHP